VARVISRLAPWSTRGGVRREGDAGRLAPSEPSDLDRLMETIEAGSGESLEPLPRSDWVSRLIPEWDHLRCLPHEALFHSHPVDIHAWRTVDEVAFAMKDDRERTGTMEAAEQVGDRRQILLAALLHDMGKGHEGDHSQVGAVIAERFAARAGLDPETGWRLAQAVRHHLLIPNVATRRDIADAKVIRETAAAVRDSRMLHLLYVLSVADSRACGPDVWSPWRAQLMQTLYLRVLDLLRSQKPAGETAGALRNEILATLSGSFGRREVEDHLAGLSPSYVLSTPPEVVGTHLRLIADAAGGTAVHHDLNGPVDRLTIVTPDRPGILALVAGTLASHNVNVLGGSAFTRDDGIAIEVFYVGDALGHGIDERRWTRVTKALPEALEGRVDVEQRLAETRRAYRAAASPRVPIETTVLVDNVASEAYSIVEVNTLDRLGLLYSITQALSRRGLNIHLAKVDTIGPEVVDAFYVQTAGGGRVDSQPDVAGVKEAVLAAVRELDAQP
ncbi:MAG: ACT domain-containing protein, partial [Dehalococcoidia bacterium]